MSRRIEILRRATEVFQRKGVQQTSMADIAQAVGVKREAIYYYFRNRREILLEIILPQSRTLHMNMQNILRSNRPSVEKLQAAIENHLQQYDPRYLEMTVALREDHFFKEDRRLSELRRVWKNYTRGWEDLIREGQKNGELRAGIDPKVAAFGILGMCNWLARWFDPAKDLSIAEITAMYCTLVTDGLSVDAGLGQKDEASPPVPAMAGRGGA